MGEQSGFYILEHPEVLFQEDVFGEYRTCRTYSRKGRWIRARLLMQLLVRSFAVHFVRNLM